MSFRCDFHVHSSVSDGSLSPTQVTERAHAKGVNAFALTDHDDTAGIEPAYRRGCELGVEVIGGIEISVNEDGGRRQMHILGLGIDPDHGGLGARMRSFRLDREARCARMVELLAGLGARISLVRVREIAGAGSVGRPHVARALVEAGVCSTPDEAFGRFLRSGGPAFVQHTELFAAEAIELIHAAGGIASLAHPRLSIGVDAPGGLEAYVERLARLGLDGLEVAHPSLRRGQERRVRQLAHGLGLVATGGSDFHGADRPDVEIGRGRGRLRLGEPFYLQILERIAQRRINPAALTLSSAGGTLARSHERA
jgi:predicted metal-dependent phosphoesterase TrpH